MRRRSGYLTLAVVFAVLGFLISMQYKVQQRLAESPAVGRDLAAAVRLKLAEDERQKLRDEVAQLRQQVADMGKQQGAYDGLIRALEETQRWSGLAELRGPGLVVTMEDSKLPRRPGENPNALILHDEDILMVVNELRASGAEAISINGQRLVGGTEIRCVGPAVVINGTRVAPPLTILAIGDAEVLESGIHLRGGVADKLALYSIPVTVRKEREVHLPAYQGGLSQRFAQPVKGGA